MIKVKTENGVTIPLSPKVVKEIINYVCKNLDVEYDTLHGLLELNHPHYSRLIFRKVDISDLRVEDCDLLWKQLPRENRVSMCEEMSFCKNLSKEQMLDILQENDQEIILAVIGGLPVDLTRFTRLAPEDARHFLEQLRQHPSLAIRQALMGEEIMTDVEEYTIEECFALGKIAARQLRNLKAQDIAKLDQCPPNLLKDMAMDAETINDKAVLRLFAEALLEMEDIYYAVVLAENRYLPQEILGMLARQDNKYVAAIAKNTLEKLAEEEDEDLDDEDEEEEDDD